ncbi:hypothetical protein [Halorubellus salinus]|uniref:hypothetical protein n=1 Tax=Halorubellus salinus TaxID=755309 RepID=UPI001D09631E|nr:hypothetical protein [Halorubellus salinus]
MREREQSYWGQTIRRYGLRDRTEYFEDDEKLSVLSDGLVHLMEAYGLGNIEIAHDSGAKSAEIASKLRGYIVESGTDSTVVGHRSSPEVAFLSSRIRSLCVLISGSHQSPYYTAVKMFEGGSQLCNGGLSPIFRILANQDESGRRTDYADYIAERVLDASFDPVRREIAIVDPGSAGGRTTNRILSTLGHDIRELHNVSSEDASGRWVSRFASNWSEEHTEAVRRVLTEVESELGVLIDEDGDRVVLVHPDLGPIAPDEIGAAVALAEGYTSIVCDYRCSPAVKSFLELHGIDTILSEVGRDRITDAMSLSDAELGLEISGHFFFPGSGGIRIDTPYAIALALSSPDFVGHIKEIREHASLEYRGGEYRVPLDGFDLAGFAEALASMRINGSSASFNRFPSGWMCTFEDTLHIVARRSETSDKFSLLVWSLSKEHHDRILSILDEGRP